MRLALDIGFGHTKYAFEDEKKGLVVGKIPSVVATTVENINDLSEDVFEFKGNVYYVGDLALKVKRRDIIEINDYEKLELYSPLLIGQVIKENKLEGKVTEIACGLSPAHKDNNAKYKKAIGKFLLSGQEYAFKISLLPQGVGAVKCIQTHIDEENFKEMQGIEDYLVVDIGFNTTDMIFVYGGNIQKGKINKTNSFENTGVTVIARDVQDYVRRTYEKDLSIDQTLAIVIKGGFRHRGEWFDLTETVSDFKTQYVAKMMDFLEQSYGSELDNMEKICFVGGGAYFIDTSYAKNIITFKDSEFLNVMGNLVYDYRA